MKNRETHGPRPASPPVNDRLLLFAGELAFIGMLK